MITKLKLENFTLFEELTINFSSGINVIIGENGTGKTQLLKAAYALAATSAQNREIDEEEIENIFTEKFNRIFMPEEMKLGKLSRCSDAKCASIEGHFIENYSHDKNIKFKLSSRVRSLKLEEKTEGALYGMKPIFIPTKEVLSLYKGLVTHPEHKEAFETIFDDTYFDLCQQLTDDAVEKHEARMRTFLEEIVNKIQGKFEFDGRSIAFNAGIYKKYADPKKEGTYFDPTPEEKLSTQMVAEGFRKLGVLHRLINNSTLVPKKSGSLFWDEPESNMNPKLMKLIVEILIEFAKNEQQVILSTHDYVLLKWFDLLSDDSVHVKYHVLHRDIETRKIILTSTDKYSDIAPNPIDDAFGLLIDQEIENDMGI